VGEAALGLAEERLRAAVVAVARVIEADEPPSPSVAEEWYLRPVEG
jgi:hypothetical protein